MSRGFRYTSRELIFHMRNNKSGSPLSVVARTWADETNQDYELVASILFRYSRGDYHDDIDPYISLMLSAASDPTAIPDVTIDKVNLDQGDTTISIEITDGRKTKEGYILADIDQLLVENEPNIDYSLLVDFCRLQNVPIPAFIRSSMGVGENPDVSPRLSPNELRKLKTKIRYSDWHQEYQRLKKEHPKKPHGWVAGKIHNMDIGKSHSIETIRKKMK